MWSVKKKGTDHESGKAIFTSKAHIRPMRKNKRTKVKERISESDEFYADHEVAVDDMSIDAEEPEEDSKGEIPNFYDSDSSERSLPFDDLGWNKVDISSMSVDLKDDAPAAFLGLEEIEGVDVEIVNGLGVVKVGKGPKNETPKQSKNASKKLKFIHVDDFKDVDEEKEARHNLKEGSKAVKAAAKILKKAAAKDEKVTENKQLKSVETPVTDSDVEVIGYEAWKELKLHSLLLKGLVDLGFSTPTEIQTLALRSALNTKKNGEISDRDIIGAAETGSGKTFSYGLPILQSVALSNRAALGSSTKLPCVGLILTPTRELAIQVTDHLKKVSCHLRAKIITIVGGISEEKQKRMLSYSPDIIVATPGRLWELASSDSILLHSLRAVQFLVLDEADRMLESGHFKDLDTILRQISLKRRDETGEEPMFPKPTHRRTYVFSATLIPELDRSKSKKGSARKGTVSLSDLLSKLEFDDKHPVYINASPKGEMQQRQRLKNLDRFKTLENAVLIASDVAARGLDIPAVDHVLHYQIHVHPIFIFTDLDVQLVLVQLEISVLLCSPEEMTLYKKLCSVLQKGPRNPCSQNRSREHKTTKGQHSDDWLRKAAEEADIMLPSDDEDDDMKGVMARKKQKDMSKLDGLRAELKRLLGMPVIPRATSSKYLTSNVDRDLPSILVKEEDDISKEWRSTHPKILERNIGTKVNIVHVLLELVFVKIDIEMSSGPSGGGPIRREKTRKRLFTKEIKLMMYGFGDVPNPADDTAEVLEDLLNIYINDMCQKVQSTIKGRKPKVADFLYVLRRDPKKLVRVHELLASEKELTQAKNMNLMPIDELPSKDQPSGTMLSLPPGGPSVGAFGGPLPITNYNIEASSTQRPSRPLNGIFSFEDQQYDDE
ncbi:P-loop containing nucleoside triphosphate hydrolase protein [Chytridium lagenaria]|nr:P-loop containing nucleoside triphosphate hydrolase protein [Chytridium lagenaria]